MAKFLDFCWNYKKSEGWDIFYSICIMRVADGFLILHLLHLKLPHPKRNFCCRRMQNCIFFYQMDFVSLRRDTVHKHYC